MSLPARSSSMNVMPPDAPTPGMAGGATVKAVAPGRPARRWFSLRIRTSAVRPFASRSFQGARVRKYWAVFVEVAPMTTV